MSIGDIGYSLDIDLIYMCSSIYELLGDTYGRYTFLNILMPVYFLSNSIQWSGQTQLSGPTQCIN